MESWSGWLQGWWSGWKTQYTHWLLHGFCGQQTFPGTPDRLLHAYRTKPDWLSCAPPQGQQRQRQQRTSAHQTCCKTCSRARRWLISTAQSGMQTCLLRSNIFQTSRTCQKKYSILTAITRASHAHTVMSSGTKRITGVISASKKSCLISVVLISITCILNTKVVTQNSGIKSISKIQKTVGRLKTLPFTPPDVFAFLLTDLTTANKKLKTSPFTRPSINAPGAILELVS